MNSIVLFAQELRFL